MEGSRDREDQGERRAIPDSLASLVQKEPLPPSSDPEAEYARYYDARQDPSNIGYPTPSAGNPTYYPNHETPSGLKRTPVDVARLTFQPNHVDQFKNDTVFPKFEPVRTPSAVAWNAWRRAVVSQDGCEQLAWGICDQQSNIFILLICKETLPRYT